MQGPSGSTLRRRHVVGACLCAAAALVGREALADEVFPSRQVKIIVTFGAGGIADIVARLVAVQLSAELGQPVVVENRTGASGAIGAQSVARAAADGYTLLLGTPSTQLINPLVYEKLAYDPWTDFVPVSLCADTPVVMVMRPLPGIDDLDALVRHARANPGQLSYASAGIGTTPHLGIEIFKLAVQADIVHVPFRSGAEAAAAVAAGTADLLVDAVVVLRPFLAAGQFKAVCAAGSRRSAALPDLATAAERGLGGFSVPAPWFGLAAPAGVPPQRLAILRDAATRAMQRPQLRNQLMERGIEPLPSGPDAYLSTLARERVAYEKVVKAAGITAT